MALTLTNDILKFRETTSDPWEKLLIQANMNFNLIYPVGSIYMSTVNVDPGTIFGGTWEQLKDTFLLGAGDTYTAGDTGGEATNSHTHTEGDMSAAIGATGGSPVALGYSPVSPHPRGPISTGAYTVMGASWTSDTRDFNHFTPVFGTTSTPSNSNNMPPYLVVYMWRRLTLSPTIYTPPANVLIGDVASEDIVPITKGGTGADNAADAITNLGFDSGTGHCKMPDGTLIQWGAVSFPSGVTSGYVSPISLFRFSITFPISFIDTNYCVWGSGRYSSGMGTPIGFSDGTAAIANMFWWDAAARTFSDSLPLIIRWCAIGRWK